MARLGWLFLLTGCALAGDTNPPAQAARGQAVFFSTSNARSCGSCHTLAKQGNAVGPELARLARLSPRAIAMAIRATRTQYVQTVKVKDGITFPGIPATQKDATADYFDLSVSPPVLRKLDRKDIASVSENSGWKHPPESGGYSAEQLADVIAFIKWASYGDTKGVDPADIQ